MKKHLSLHRSISALVVLGMLLDKVSTAYAAVDSGRAQGPVAAAEPATALASQADAAALSPERRDLADFVQAAYRGDAPEAAALQAWMPADEMAHALGKLTDEDLRALQSSLPILSQWRTIEANLVAAQMDPAAKARMMATAEEESPEEVRAGLLEVLEAQAAWAEWVGDGPPEFLGGLEDARRLLANLSEEELQAAARGLSFIPDWRRALAPDLNGLLGPAQVAALAERAKALSAGGAVPAGIDVTDEQCTAGDYTRNTLPLIIAYTAMLYVIRAAGFAALFATEGLKVCIGIFGAVVCVTITPNPIYVILKVVEFAARLAANGIKAAIDTANLCQAIAHWKLFIKHRDDFLVDAQMVLSELMLRHNEIVERSDRIDFTNREAWKLRLQLSIEENLLLPDPKPDGSDENRISLFQITDTVCFNPEHLLPTPVFAIPTPNVPTPEPTVDPAPVLLPLPTGRAPFQVPDPREQCGLNLVKRIVEESILMNKMAGNDVHNADDAYAAAMVHFNAGRYKSAYLRFREAYRDAVQPDAEPRALFRSLPELTGR